nr:nudix hydrolase 19, chloroplastic [Ipomoea batatas]
MSFPDPTPPSQSFVSLPYSGGDMGGFWPPLQMNQEHIELYSQFDNEPPLKRSRNSEINPLVSANAQNPKVNPPNLPGKGSNHIFYKTRMCVKFMEGNCRNGEHCTFAHGAEDLREPPPNWQDIVREKDKDRGAGNWNNDQKVIHRMKICKKFYNGEECPYGERCNFLHERSPQFKNDMAREQRESSAISIGTTGSMLGRRSDSDQYEINQHASVDSDAYRIKPTFWKTKICSKWEITGQCPFGERCHFAHGHSDAILAVPHYDTVPILSFKHDPALPIFLKIMLPLAELRWKQQRILRPPQSSLLLLHSYGRHWFFSDSGRPLAGSSGSPDPNWHLGWLDFGDCRGLLENYAVKLSEESLVYLGSKNGEDDNQSVVYWAVDVSEGGNDLVKALGARQLCFVELRTLMVASDWADSRAMGELAIAGHGRALLEWHGVSRFCGFCGSKTVPADAGRRKLCSNELCKKRVYPRVDPVHSDIFIDKENDRALLSRQSRFVPRMWSCLAGFMEPGESLEEAVRRETREETGIEVGEVVYHSSQPWPVGPSSMPCQLMVGFFAYAKSFEIEVDKEELEDAQWHSREDVKKALTLAEYHKAQKTTAAKVDQMCKGVEKEQNLATTYNVDSGELAPMFVPGPYAIAHHLISSWANQVGINNGNGTQSKLPAASLPKL